MADLTTKLGGVTLKNPVMTASGTFGYGFEYHNYYDISRLGAVVVKGIRMKPSHGNPTPRVAEVTGGMLNAIGLQGPGVEKFLHGDRYMPFLRKVGAATIVNIWGTTIAEYGEVAARLDAERDGITALEINISCPNVKAGGVAFGTDPVLAAEVDATYRDLCAVMLRYRFHRNVAIRRAVLARFLALTKYSGSLCVDAQCVEFQSRERVRAWMESIGYNDTDDICRAFASSILQQLKDWFLCCNKHNTSLPSTVPPSSDPPACTAPRSPRTSR